MREYKVLGPIKTLDGIIATGLIMLAINEAEDLIKIGAIAELEAPPEKTALSEDQKLDAVKAAIGTLDADNTDVWTGAGKPNAAALTAIVGFDVSAVLRDAAWDLVKPAT